MMIKKILLSFAAIAAVTAVYAQDNSSTATMRRGGRKSKTESTPGVTQRMQQHMQSEPVGDADMSWMKVIYRSLDLTKESNAPLYFPEQPAEGEESLIRLIMRLLANNQLTVYEYLDGRESFTDQYKIKVRDMLDRFHIYYQEAKGSSERNPKFTIDDSDMPTTEVLSYYIIERWEFDKRSNRMRSRVEAICPVLHRSDDYGMQSVKYPMFWVKYDDLRPYLSTQNIFVSDYNNMPSCTYDDYFQLGLYDGEIYKTKNLRNKSMAQLYPDPEDMKKAQDSIQAQLDKFEDKLWVPSLEELEKQREQRELLAQEADSTATGASVASKGRKSTTARGRSKAKDSKPAKVKRGKRKSEPKTKSAATRSVRNRKR